MDEQKESKTREKKFYREVEFARDASGKYVYVGGYHVLKKEESEYAGTVKRSILILLPSLLLAILAGSINGTGIDDASGIMVFYLIGLILLVFTVFSLLRMLRYGCTMKNYDYKASAARLPFLSIGLFLCGACGLICIGIRLVRRIYEATPLGAAVLILSFAAEITGGWFMRKKMEDWIWEEKPGTYETMKASSENGPDNGPDNGGSAK